MKKVILMLLVLVMALAPVGAMAEESVPAYKMTEASGVVAAAEVASVTKIMQVANTPYGQVVCSETDGVDYNLVLKKWDGTEFDMYASVPAYDAAGNKPAMANMFFSPDNKTVAFTVIIAADRYITIGETVYQVPKGQYVFAVDLATETIVYGINPIY